MACGADFLDVLAYLALVVGIDLPEDRRAAIALALQGQGWTVGELKLAAVALSVDPTLDDKIRYGGTVTPADFMRLRGDPASPVAGGKLYTYHEALRLWDIRGNPGTFPETLFRPVPTDDGQRWRLK